MTSRQKKFVHEYIIDLNATQAAIRAGYSPRTARQIGHRLLTNVDIEAAIIKGKKEVLDKIKADQYRTIKRLLNCVLVDIRKLFTPEGNIKHITDLDPDTAAAIQSFEVVQRKSSGGMNSKEDVQEEVYKVRLVDKKSCLELMMKYQGLLSEHHNVNLNHEAGSVRLPPKKPVGAPTQMD